MTDNFLYDNYKEDVFLNVNMSEYTTFKIGGPADYMVFPKDEDQLVNTIIGCKRNNLPYTFIGKGSNVLVSDKGVRGLVINLSDNFNDIYLADKEYDDTVIYAQSGATLSKIAIFAQKKGLSGFEFASGIPGTSGGGILMNAGAYGGELSDVCIKTKYYNVTDNKVDILTKEQHKFEYRYSIFQKTSDLILGTYFQFSKSNNPNDILLKMKELNAKRKEKQPLNYPSAGSAFKRPEGYFAAKLIDECGLKGYRIGNAKVSDKHCGFIINTGNATCEDVISLIEHIKNSVYNKKEILLESEIKIIGDFS